MVERSDAVSCYNCSPETCADPFVPASTPTCSGSVCTITFLSFTGRTDKSFTVGFCYRKKEYNKTHVRVNR